MRSSLSSSLKLAVVAALSVAALAALEWSRRAEHGRAGASGTRGRRPGIRQIVQAERRLRRRLLLGRQAVFQHIRASSRRPRAMRAARPTPPSTSLVSTGGTGHAESVRVTFDPAQVSFGQLLQVFFSVAHDPTELNRQGPDDGTQYRSAVFFTTPDQQRVTAAYIAQLEGQVARRPHRHPGRAAGRVLSRRGLPPGLCPPAP